jgi:hypothetical protein
MFKPFILFFVVILIISCLGISKTTNKSKCVYFYLRLPYNNQGKIVYEEDTIIVCKNNNDFIYAMPITRYEEYNDQLKIWNSKDYYVTKEREKKGKIFDDKLKFKRFFDKDSFINNQFNKQIKTANENSDFKLFEKKISLDGNSLIEIFVPLVKSAFVDTLFQYYNKKANDIFINIDKKQDSLHKLKLYKFVVKSINNKDSLNVLTSVLSFEMAFKKYDKIELINKLFEK